MPIDKSLQSLYRADPDAVWKETVQHEMQAKIKWEEEWGFTVDLYKKCQRDSADVSVVETKEVDKKPVKQLPVYPDTSSKHIGWLSGNKDFKYSQFSELRKPINTLYKTLGWPVDSCP